MDSRSSWKVGLYSAVAGMAVLVAIALTAMHGATPGPQADLGSQAVASPAAESASMAVAEPSVPDYRPMERLELADPTNYGERYTTDAYGQALNHEYVVVLHETVGTAQSAINLFKTPHPRDEDQASYHTIVDRDGTVIYIVPPEKRAYGAGNSVFQGRDGEETAVTNPRLAASVNNFAYHISLATPPDGQLNNASRHSGYTEAQYRSLAWLIAQTTIPDERITSHEAVDRSGMRRDPRSFNWPHLMEYLHEYPGRAA